MPSRTATGLIFPAFLCATFLLASAYGMVLLLPLATEAAGGDAADAGRIQAVIGLATMAAILAAGHIVDRIGRLPALALGAGAVAAGLLIFAWAGDLALFMAAAAPLFGLGWGVFFAQKLVVLATITPPQARFRRYTLLAIALMAGFGLSPAVGAWLIALTDDVATPFWTMAALCLAAGVIYAGLARPIAAAVLQDEARAALDLATAAAVLASPARVPIALTFVSACVFSGMHAFQTVLARDQGLDYADFYLAYTAAVILARLALAGRINGDNAYRAIAVLYFVMTAAVALYLAVDGMFALFIAVAALFGLGYGASSPIVQTMGANESSAETMSQALQILVLTHVAGVFGFPLLAGWLLTKVGATAMLSVLIALSAFVFLLSLRAAMRAPLKAARPVA